MIGVGMLPCGYDDGVYDALVQACDLTLTNEETEALISDLNEAIAALGIQQRLLAEMNEEEHRVESAETQTRLIALRDALRANEDDPFAADLALPDE